MAVKVRYSEKATTIWPISHLFDATKMSNYKWKTGKIVVAFSEYLKFKGNFSVESAKSQKLLSSQFTFIFPLVILWQLNYVLFLLCTIEQASSEF